MLRQTSSWSGQLIVDYARVFTVIGRLFIQRLKEGLHVIRDFLLW